MTAIDSLDTADLGDVHIVGIGGAGMSGIARILVARSVRVQGSDAKDSRRIAALRALGATIHIGHDAHNLGSAQTVIISTAIPPDNPELVEARSRGIRVLNRAQALAVLMADSRPLAVSGTHGKTTTTSMLTVALQHAGLDPSFVIGSELNESGSNAHYGTGPYFVVEADESDGTFLHLRAVAGIVTNCEADHLDYWGDFDQIEQAFDTFVRDIDRRGGFVVVCTDDPGGRRLAERALAQGHDVRTYGLNSGADHRVRLLDSVHVNGVSCWQFEVSIQGVLTGPIRLAVPGKHNVLNATAALVCAIGLGVPVETARQGIEAFSGTRRRFEFRGQADGVRVYDDYAHHPTEIRATLEAAREMAGTGQLIVAFQAHHYYRTALFAEEFPAALSLADHVVVLEVFAPGEEPIPGASGQTMAARVALDPSRVAFEPSWSAVPGELVGRSAPGDVIMTLGAGDISMMSPEILDLLGQRQRDRSQGGQP